MINEFICGEEIKKLPGIQDFVKLMINILETSGCQGARLGNPLKN